MSALQLRGLVDALCAASDCGATIVSHGGTASDFRVLWHGVEDAAYRARVLRLATAHVDVALACAAQTGYVMSLLALAKGMGLEAKGDDASSGAPSAWLSGDARAQARVLELVASDARVTAQVFYEVACRGRQLQWVSGKGRLLALPDFGAHAQRAIPCALEAARMAPPTTPFVVPAELRHTTLSHWLLASAPP